MMLEAFRNHDAPPIVAPPPPETVAAILRRTRAKVERGTELLVAMQDIGARSRPAVGAALYRALPYWGWRFRNGSGKAALHEHDLAAWCTAHDRAAVLTLIDRALKIQVGLSNIRPNDTGGRSDVHG